MSCARCPPRWRRRAASTTRRGSTPFARSEELVCVATAAQSSLSVELDESQRAEQESLGVPPTQQGRGVAAQVALARRESHHRGQRHLGLAKIVASELPHTWAAWRAGRITEWKATLIARETACLIREDRAAVDAAVCGDGARVERMGDRELAMACQKEAYRLDPESYVARRRRAEADRNVTLRPAPDAMTWLTALLPVKDGVAAYAALTRTADSARAAGDTRGKGQLMADTLVDSVLDSASARDDAVTRWSATPASGAAGDPNSPPCGRHRARPGDDRRGTVRHQRRARPRRRLRAYPGRAGPRDRGRRVLARRRSGSDACSPVRTTGELVAMDLAAGSSATTWAALSRSATSSAAPRGATPRSATATTPSTSPTTDRRPPTTPRGCARPAATPSRRSAGAPDPRPPRATTRSRPPPRPATRMAPPRRRCS